MPPNAVETYKELLEKEPKIDDKYVIIDIKWLKQWKRFIGIDKSDEKQVIDPGPIDFEKLTDPTTANNINEVQLRSDALEGNDYGFIPYELYQDLVRTYDKIGTEIVRRVVPQGPFQTVIETFLVPLRLRQSSSDNAKVKQIYRSRRTRIDEIQKDICNEFDIPFNSDYRLYSSVDEQGHKWELIDESSDSTLEDIILTKNAFIICEDQTPPSPSLKALSWKVEYTRGLCGLSNLGNTCFMNSALQCLSNVPALTTYFLSDEYKEHINYNNPLGMKGDVATAYGQLLQEMWSGTTDYYAPKLLKQSVAKYAPQFSGFSQQDSQEFMSFLLDGLHEDLNQVKIKPYVEKKDDDGITDDDTLARDQWEDYLKRNQSKIQDIFHGQIKSLVQCLICQTIGRTFDPICFLSLSLPFKAKIRTFKIEYVRLNGQIKTYRIKCNEEGHMCNLVQKFCDGFQEKKKDTRENDQEEEEEEEGEDFTKDDDYDGHKPKPNCILPVEVFNHRIHLQYRNDSALNNIFKNDQIIFYEIPDPSKEENKENISIPCIFRDDYFQYNFGLPIYISVPTNNCKGSDIQEALEKRIGDFLPLPSTDSSNKASYTVSLGTDHFHSMISPLSLDDHIDFTHTSRIVYVTVASSIVDEYKNRSKKEPVSPMSPGIQIGYQPKRETTTLLDCIKSFTKKEVLSDDDLWRCPKCKEFQKATKQIDLWLLPKILIIQLKRFSYTRYFRDKIDLFVDCPIRNLDLSQFVFNPAEKSKAKYDLIAVSNHSGYLGGGHYTAHAKNSTDKQWHTFNDSYVSKINEDNIISDEAYVLIYQRQE